MKPSMQRDPLFKVKLAGGFLTALLVVLLIGFASDFIFAPHPPESVAGAATGGYPVEGSSAGSPTGAAGAAEETDAPSLEVLLGLATPENGPGLARKCVSCHSFGKNEAHKIGPNLWGVVGKQVAAVADYAYSPALRGAGGTWTPERLDAFLAAPARSIRGTKMSYAGLRNPNQRADLIAWLAQQADNPIRFEPPVESPAPEPVSPVEEAPSETPAETPGATTEQETEQTEQTQNTQNTGQETQETAPPAAEASETSS